MEIDYENSEIQKYFSDLCNVQNSKNLLQRKIGQQLARKSKQRIVQLSFLLLVIHLNCRNNPAFLNFPSLLQ